MSAPTSIKDSTCLIYLAFDVGLMIDLEQAARRLKEEVERPQLGKEKRHPKYFGYRPRPVRMTQTANPIKIGEHFTENSVEMTLWDFGALSIAYKVVLKEGTTFDELVELSALLYDTDPLSADAKSRVEYLVRELGVAVTRPLVESTFEDYVIFEITALETPIAGGEFVEKFSLPVAQILRADRAELSNDVVNDALEYRSAFTPNDTVIIDWNTAVIYGSDNEGTRAVIEFSQVQLLEMRLLDEQLDSYLEDAYRVSLSATAPFWYRTDISRVGRLSVDAAMLFESVSNALKIIGDQFLAEVQELSSERLKLPELDANILRKLNTLDGIYQKVSDRSAIRRAEIMELTIIFLIALELVRGFF